MAKIVAMHQPNYLPWIGLFAKLCLADTLIVYDTAQYEKNSVINRNKIRTKEGSVYLTVPVGKWPCHTRIIDVSLPECDNWKKNHWKSLCTYYGRAPFFHRYGPALADLYRRDFTSLAVLNLAIIQYMLECFQISIEIVKASDLKVDSTLQKTDLMVALLEAVGAEVYLSGPSGREYLEFDKFPQSGIALRFSRFIHPVYRQAFPGFQPNMSAVDLLFNEGPGAGAIIRQAAAIESVDRAIEEELRVFQC